MTSPTAQTRGKHDFSGLYVAEDPRALAAELASLDYRVPAYGAALSRAVIDSIGLEGPLLDLASSYGYGSAVLNHDIALDELFAHYAAAADATRDELVARDRALLAGRRRADAVPVVVLDSSAPAVRYALDAGIADAGVVADLEAGGPVSPPPADLEPLRGVGGIAVTGAMSYLGPRTYTRVLDATARRPWLAGFALRWVDVGPVLDVLRARRYRVQILPDHVVVQRRATGPDEVAAMQAGLARLGRSPGALERRGVHTAVPFLAVPEERDSPDLVVLARTAGAVRG
jgi:hypothetical protein